MQFLLLKLFGETFMSSKLGKAFYWMAIAAIVIAAIAIPTYLVRNTIHSLEDKLAQANSTIGSQKQSIDQLTKDVADLNKQISDWKKSAEINNDAENTNNKIEKVSDKLHDQKQAVVKNKIDVAKAKPGQTPDQINSAVSAVLIDDLWSNHCKMTKDATSANCALVPITP